MSFLRLARVADVHPEDHSVDLVMTDDGSRYPGVQVLTLTATTNSGVADLPDVTATGQKWSLTESTDRDMLAIVGFMAPTVPIVLGFLFPQANQMLFADRNRRVERHASDVYTSTDGEGNFELYHPSGTYLRIGTSGEHEDLSGQDFDARWAINKNTDKAVHVHLRVSNAGAEKASLDIDPDGNIDLDHVGNLVTHTGGNATVDVDGNATATVGGNLSATIIGTTHVESGGAATLKAPTVTIDSPSTTCTGTLTVQGLLTYLAGMVGSGTGPGGAGASLTGNLQVTGNISNTGTLTNASKNVGSTHTHTGVQPGGGTSGAPT